MYFIFVSVGGYWFGERVDLPPPVQDRVYTCANIRYSCFRAVQRKLVSTGNRTLVI